MVMVTAVLDVMCAMGVVGVALVTGMTDVAHGGSRPGLGQRLRRDRRPGHPVYARHAAPDDRVRRARRGMPHPRPGRDGCAAADRGRGDGR
ncbi:hypothetical protein SAMN05428954_2433 [Streptomyces sp. 2112.3]|nr:hypothetical protein BX261_4915 [Streptomyces sp. 2321.6]SDR24703.1 hypothetical protein SAMN05216511_2346 [Streptomyces sp. KS_16]SED49252.1 hypothetical protein SAMN05428940_4942 [Streptomyces sp. 2133.1]SEE36900.1 hypothetical protein SAMN05428954_2433 [Streptomyces sp. 2112.3]SNC70942.1 hypothetical protein SAMN06272741_4842 [Streptomyces sp. 2114.4]